MEVIKRWGAPDKETIGSINDLRVDLYTNDVYRCTGIKTSGEECGDAIIHATTMDNTEYTWELVGGSAGGGAILADMQTVDMARGGRINATNFEKFSKEYNYIVHFRADGIDRMLAISGGTPSSSFSTDDPASGTQYDNTVVEYPDYESLESATYCGLRVAIIDGDGTVFSIISATDENGGYYLIGKEAGGRDYEDFSIAIERVASALA